MSDRQEARSAAQGHEVEGTVPSQWWLDLKVENQRLREALTYYAEGRYPDGGEIAREALSAATTELAVSRAFREFCEKFDLAPGKDTPHSEAFYQGWHAGREALAPGVRVTGPYFVADEYEWQDADSLNDAVLLALDCQRRQDEPVDVYEKVDWRRCLLPEEAS